MTDTQNTIQGKKIQKKSTKKTQLYGIISEFEDLILDKLTGFIGKNRSEVEGFIIKEWIDINSNKIEEMLNIDLNELRRQLNTNNMELELQNEEKIIETLKKMFIVIRRISIKKLANTLSITQNSLERIVLLKTEEIKPENLSVKYNDGYIEINKA